MMYQISFPRNETSLASSRTWFIRADRAKIRREVEWNLIEGWRDGRASGLHPHQQPINALRKWQVRKWASLKNADRNFLEVESSSLIACHR
ncbi:hypothetical protein AVEN_184693-1 [Araneus ventricosus]|uniref:Uncharacterized protein n=1 Tax=Araneus ventricosus TaxID=182803 RepID=A0A4Y2D3R0_ARAVE|nr:hypothetical protein AVEN_184693-1 [Araneus ventricosus]